jgi:hypothetical protein
VVVLVASLTLSVVARQLGTSYRQRPNIAGSSVAIAATPISSFDSYALALLLGGLRGPLVMLLWPSAEAQKSERNLEDFDTKVEWIRLLQPEFDSVHIFQIWNKAYNISVQMASIANKYSTILDALNYASSVDAERPNNINVLMAKAQVWFDKLGNSQEKAYYRSRVRQETQARTEPEVRRSSRVVGSLKLEPMLDDKGNILPKFLTPTLTASVSPGTDLPDGSDLQYLKPFEPFPQGLSPFALGYNYYKRSQMLQNAGKQKHLQLSELVIDSRPALSLKTWAEEEWERGRRFEAEAFGRPASPIAERIDLEAITADVPPATAPTNLDAANNAIYSYNRAIQLGEASLVEYQRHLAKYLQSVATYRSHQDTVNAFILIAKADRDYLLAQMASGVERQRLLTTAAESYRLASERVALIIVRYYIDEEITSRLMPPDTSRFQLQPDPSRPDMLTRMALQADRIQRGRENIPDQFMEDRAEYMQYLSRVNMRLGMIQ